MSGKAATFGGRMMGSVADQVLKQFAANFATQVQALQARQVVDAPAAAPVLAPTQEPAQLNGLALMWAVIKDWLRSLFGAKKA